MRFATTLRGAAAAAIVVVSTQAGVAGECRHDYCWGGLAAGQNGIAARASGFRTATEAWDRVAKICNDKCQEILVFPMGCGAIVQVDRDLTVAGFGDSYEKALSEAVRICEAKGGRTCAVRVHTCSH